MEIAFDLTPPQSEITQSLTESSAYTQLKVIKCAFKWTIDNFSSRCDDVGEVLPSPSFPVGSSDKQKWYIHLYLQGKREKCSDYLSLYLKPAECTEEIRAEYQFSILNDLKEETHTKISTTLFTNIIHHRCRGFGKFIARHILLENSENLLPDDKLTLCCKVSVFVDIYNICSTNEPIQVLECRCAGDFGKLFGCQNLSDVTLVSTDGSEFPAHKTILAVRSPVFSDMFEHQMKEDVLGRVEVTDMDRELLQEMLHYIYTGKVNNIEDRTEDLLKAADKFQLDRLKRICETNLCRKLTVNNIVEVLILSDTYNARKLKAWAIHFITTHATDVMDTDRWREINRANPSLMDELYRGFGAQLETLIGPPEKRLRL